jgi:hypothetical protein
VNPLRLEVDLHVLKEFLEIFVLLAELVYRFPVQNVPSACRIQDTGTVDVLRIKMANPNSER